MVRLASILVLPALLAGCGSPAGPATERTPAFLNLTPDASYVGDDVCATCHETEWQGYQSHGMARSWYPMTADVVMETFPGRVVTDSASGLQYRAFREGNRFYQEEFRTDRAGRQTHRLVREMSFVMGSGNAARTYFADEAGWLHQLPLTWYSREGIWAFSPGYERANKRFDRLLSDRCMACHNAYPEAVPFTDGKYASIPDGIGCERCHGPGSVHVEERRAVPEAPDIDRSIINPAHLPFERQLDVCSQCHLNTTVSVLRSGRTAFGYRPSEPLDSYVALFAAGGPSAGDEVGVISHADRMQRSDCFVATVAAGGEMTCVTCHDPHQGFRDKGPGYFDRACRSCHQGPPTDEGHEAVPGYVGAPCAGCHMPKVASDEAPHASFTDHWVRVVEPSVAAGADAGPDGQVLSAYFERDRAGPEADRYRGIAFLVLGRQRGDSAAYRAGVDLLDAFVDTHSDDAEALYYAGFGRAALGRVEEATADLEASVRLDSSRPERLNDLALALELTGRDASVTEGLYREALRIQPARADIRINYGRFLETSGRLDEAGAAYRAAAAERPWMAESWYNLGTIALRQGREQDAETYLGQALELDPDYARALSNLAVLRLQGGDEVRGRELLERAVRADPGDATALGNLGAYHLERDDLDRAIPLLRRAVEAGPRSVDALAHLALAYIQLDRPDDAAPLVERVLRLDPGHELALRIRKAL